MHKETKFRQAIVFGTTVNFQRRNRHIASVRWHDCWKDIYASDRDAAIAKYVYEKKGVILLPDEVAKTKQVDPATLPLFQTINQPPTFRSTANA